MRLEGPAGVVLRSHSAVVNGEAASGREKKERPMGIKLTDETSARLEVRPKAPSSKSGQPAKMPRN